jgi:hypothetical protein
LKKGGHPLNRQDPGKNHILFLQDASTDERNKIIWYTLY